MSGGVHLISLALSFCYLVSVFLFSVKRLGHSRAARNSELPQGTIALPAGTVEQSNATVALDNFLDESKWSIRTCA
jgi:hypothetical protein